MYICIIFIFRSLFCAFSFFFLSLSRPGFYLLPFFSVPLCVHNIAFFIWCSIFFFAVCDSPRFFIFFVRICKLLSFKIQSFHIVALYTYTLCDERARGRAIQTFFFVPFVMFCKCLFFCTLF